MEEDKVALKSQLVTKLNWSLEGCPVNAKSASLESIEDSAIPAGHLENKTTEETHAVNELKIKQEDTEANTAHNEIGEYNGSISENEYNFQRGIDSVHANNGTSIEIRDDNVPNEYFVISEIDLGEEANYYFDPTKRKRIKKSTALKYIDQLQQYALQNGLTEVYDKLSEIELLIKLTSPKSFTERRTAINENKNQRSQQEIVFNERYTDKTDSYPHLAQSTNSSVLTTVSPVVYASNSGPEFVRENQNNTSKTDFNRENTSLIRKKTNAERMREYRERKKQRRLLELHLNGNTDIVKLKKTPAERMREYRARKKLLAQQAFLCASVSYSKTDLTSGHSGLFKFKKDSNSINASVVNEDVVEVYDLSESDGSVTLCKNENISQDFPHEDDPIAVNESTYLCEASLSDIGEKIYEIENTSQDSLCAGLNTLDGITVQESNTQNVESEQDDGTVLSEEDQKTCELLTPLIDQGLRREKRPEGKSTEHERRFKEKKLIEKFRSSRAKEMSDVEKRRQRCAERVRRWRERKRQRRLQESNLNDNTDIVKLKKTPTERMREYRARKKLLAQQATEEVSNSKTDLTSGLSGDSNSINASVVNEDVAEVYDLSESDGSVTLCGNEHISQDFPHIDDPIAVNESAYLCEASLSDIGEKICKIENTSKDSPDARLNTLDGITVEESNTQNVESEQDYGTVLSEEDQNTCELLTPLIEQGLRREKTPEGKSTEHVRRFKEKKPIKNVRSSSANELSKDEKRRQRCAERVRRFRERKKLEKLSAMGNL
ncbi:PREDICTED: uncharacterized protein LOC108365908 isoform X2 [Rhagoletis zephyria]|uniref:uncharacterized protein LOC108365908 isoform X2 n=1 Tax=Rhagoletis zephyria TaxID=28612 RepID=UPI0008112FD6|nr:PREDICTED: uncharacterized protein LOC108365908 isoform X2 [Rhagoletis zephyria]